MVDYLSEADRKWVAEARAKFIERVEKRADLNPDWEKVDARAVVNGSKAQDQNVLQKAIDDIARLRLILGRVDHTLSVHGHIDAETALHQLIRNRL